MSEIILIVSIICQTNITNITMPKEDKIFCVEQMTNCLVGPSGVYLRDKREACENTYNINKKNRSKND